MRWAEELAALPNEGPTLPPVALDAVLMRLMAGYTVRSAVPRRDDVFIWGRLEARLQSPDLMILAGLNEDVWPEAADPGPWLSRGMRLAVGPRAARAAAWPRVARLPDGGRQCRGRSSRGPTASAAVR